MKKFGSVACLCMLVFAMSGCRKPFHSEMLVDVGTSDVAFLVETVNDEGQAVVAPNDPKNADVTNFYRDRMVNARKVIIPYYWKQTKHNGYIFKRDTAMNGQWMPAARLIIVDTQPETREWFPDKNTHGGIWVESKDSVGCSTGINVTANIDSKEDAIIFLNNYPPATTREIINENEEKFVVEVTSLEQIMDREVRTKIQEVFAYEAASYTMDELRENKQQVMDTIKEKVVPYFKEKGITITTIGQFGGFTYENEQIQLAIDKVFQAQQDEEVAKAEAKAAEQRKVALKLKGEGEAEQALEISRGKAEAVKLEAQAEAEAIRQVADAKEYELQKLQANPEAYLSLKNLEIQMKQLEVWDGSYPNFLVEGGDGIKTPPMILNLPVKAEK